MGNKFFSINYQGREFKDIVPQDLLMDPDTERVLYGDELRDGMRVILQPGYGRVSIGHSFNHGEAIYQNRWCIVTQLRVFEPKKSVREEEDLAVFSVNGLELNVETLSWGIKPTPVFAISFVGVYDDGLTHVRDTSSSAGWLAKKDGL